tara:strand:+ start:288 stop:425 length:138 start_codon:yes stop_codon:yes gene_type:complete
MKNLTKESLEAILNDVFKKNIKDLQKNQRSIVPALDENGKFVRYE